jgi:hypothetical protein
MRDVPMGGLFDTSCKWCIILLHCGVRPFGTRFILWIFLLSDDFYGFGCNHSFTHDMTSFLGYVLLGVKCLLGCYCITNLALQCPFLVKHCYLALEGFSVDSQLFLNFLLCIFVSLFNLRIVLIHLVFYIGWKYITLGIKRSIDEILSILIIRKGFL